MSGANPSFGLVFTFWETRSSSQKWEKRKNWKPFCPRQNQCLNLDFAERIEQRNVCKFQKQNQKKWKLKNFFKAFLLEHTFFSFIIKWSICEEEMMGKCFFFNCYCFWSELLRKTRLIVCVLLRVSWVFYRNPLVYQCFCSSMLRAFLIFTFGKSNIITSFLHKNW